MLKSAGCGVLTLISVFGCAEQSDSGDFDAAGGAGPRDGAGGASATSGATTSLPPSASGASPSAAGSTGDSGSGNASAGGATTAGSGNAANAAASGSAGVQGGAGAPSKPVTSGLPFADTFESGAIDHNVWYAVTKQVVDPSYAGWSIVPSDAGKAVKLMADGSEQYLEGGNGAWTDIRAEMRVQVVSGSPEVDLAVRYHAVKEYYYLSFGNNLFKIRDRTGANSDLFPTTKPMQVAGNWYKIAIQVKGTQVSAWLDDVMLTSGTFASSPINGGGIAFGVRDGTGVALFDDVRVTAP